MENHKLLINESSSIKAALEILQDSGKKLLIVHDDFDIVKGVITDGDIRRGLLQGELLENKVNRIMQKDFIYIRDGESINKVKNKAFELSTDGIPVLDTHDKLVRIIWLNHRLRDFNSNNNRIIIMAGGKGTRL